MVLAVDASTPARWSAATLGANATFTSASFTPPAGALLVLMIASDSNAQTALTFTVADSQSGAWTQQVKEDGTDLDPATGGGAYVWTRNTTTSNTSMTITATRVTSPGEGTGRVSCMAYVVTGQAASPVGATARNKQTSGTSWTPAGPTTTVANAFIFAVFTDWQANPSPASSDLTADGLQYSGAISVLSGYKNVASAGATTANFNVSSGTMNTCYCALEIQPAAAGGGGFIPLGVYTPGTTQARNRPGGG
jgi:hypothetical protein